MAKTKHKIEGVDPRSGGARRARGLTKVSVWLDDDEMDRIERIRAKLKKSPDAMTTHDYSVTAAIRLALATTVKK